MVKIMFFRSLLKDYKQVLRTCLKSRNVRFFAMITVIFMLIGLITIQKILAIIKNHGLFLR